MSQSSGMKPQHQIQAELEELGISIPTGLKLPFSSPDGYFEMLQDEILAQAKQAAFLENLPKKSPFELPQSYFQTFESNLADKLIEDSWSKKNPFTVPDNYFDHFESDLLAQLKLENTTKSNPYEVPSGYFESFEESLQHKIQSKPNQRAVIKPFRRTYANLAIAASLALFISIGFGILNRNTPQNFEMQLSKISDAEIENYLLEHQNEFASDIETLNLNNEEELNKLEKDIFENQLNDLSADELSNYL